MLHHPNPRRPNLEYDYTPWIAAGIVLLIGVAVGVRLGLGLGHFRRRRHGRRAGQGARQGRRRALAGAQEDRGEEVSDPSRSLRAVSLR